MTQIKTPEQIANAQMFAFNGVDTGWRIQPEVDEGQLFQDVEQQSAEYIRDQIVEAIEADRKQRDLYELLAEALDDRAEGLHDDEYPEATERRKAAAEALRNNEGDEAWCNFIGPMLDEMEEEYGR